MYIFAAHNVSSKKADWLSKSRVWHYDIYTNTVHVQSFVPVVDANGVPCMHEMLSGTNHYNKGSGAFSVGRIISSEVKLDLSSHTGILTGSKIISFTQRPSYCTTFTLDVEHANDIDAEVREDGVYLVGKDSTVPLWAVWTGDAGNGDIHDPANWCCMNFMWTVLDGAVPCTRTIILVTGETSIPLAAGNLPFCSSIQFSGNIKLTANCDWRGLGKFVIPDGLSIDLNANSLYLDGFMMERGTFASVTDTSDGGGELHVNVAENDVLLNDCVALLGGMRLVKEGPGIFIAALPNQQYTGGTEVTGGIFRLTYPGPTVGYQSLVGPEVNSVTVKANGIFDVNANYGQSINYTLDGGILTSSQRTRPDRRQVGTDFYLESDSVVSNKNLGFIRGGWGEVTAHLNGHTLRTEFIRNTGNSFYMCHTTFEGEGKIEVGSGWLQTTNYSNYACIGRNLTVEFPNVDGGGLWLQAPFTVSNYLSRVGYNTGNATLTVLGAFTPVDNGTNQFPNIFMPGGSTLDLSRMDTPFSVIDQNGHKVELENGAAYSVYVGLRGIAVGDKLVSWESMPDASTDFRLVCDGEPAETRGLAAVARSDGLYVKSAATPAYAMWDLEAGQWRFFTADGVAYQDEWADGITRDIEVRFSSYEEYSAIKAQAVRPSAFRLTGLTLPEGSDFYDMDPGFKLDFNAGLVIDVKGNSLKLPVSTVSDDKASTVTSSVDGGELIVDVPVGATVANTAMSLTGSLSLVKRGEGTFVSKKAQTYTGGTFVEAGKAQPPNGSAASTTYSWDNFKAFGTGEITVAENAAFDLRSNYA
ncbi:MAG: hypothetical protein IJU44_05565 [Kiritimatiellae bacterium]|nr:hypothetical protein [Kiritimatiellia bacterium]